MQTFQEATMTDSAIELKKPKSKKKMWYYSWKRIINLRKISAEDNYGGFSEDFENFAHFEAI